MYGARELRRIQRATGERPRLTFIWTAAVCRIMRTPDGPIAFEERRHFSISIAMELEGNSLDSIRGFTPQAMSSIPAGCIASRSMATNDRVAGTAHAVAGALLIDLTAQLDGCERRPQGSTTVDRSPRIARPTLRVHPAVTTPLPSTGALCLLAAPAIVLKRAQE